MLHLRHYFYPPPNTIFTPTSSFPKGIYTFFVFTARPSTSYHEDTSHSHNGKFFLGIKRRNGKIVGLCIGRMNRKEGNGVSDERGNT